MVDLPPSIGVLVVTDEAGEAVAKDIAQHVAAMAPKYLTREDVPADVVEKEREIAPACRGPLAELLEQDVRVGVLARGRGQVRSRRPCPRALTEVRRAWNSPSPSMASPPTDSSGDFPWRSHAKI